MSAVHLAAAWLFGLSLLQTPGADPASNDAAERAQAGAAPNVQRRVEQTKTDHDKSDAFTPQKASAASDAFQRQPEMGVVKGFEFARDPLNAKKPMQTFEETMAAESQRKPAVMQRQRELLASRYDLTPRFDGRTKMSRGKPVPVGPTARLPEGSDWDRLSAAAPEELRNKRWFPYPPLPHPLQSTGGQVFPGVQTEAFPRLVRFDVEFDLPEAFLPEFPPAIYLQSRPELGDVSRGEVVNINNYYRLFKDLLTPVQLDGLRLLSTPFPQEEFNPTDDRKSPHPSLGVACFDCHLNGHTTAQFHLNPDGRPQQRRMRLDTPSLRGVFNQQIHSSKRSLRSIEDFTEFEFRTAYFNADPIHAMKKGMTILDRVQVSHMAQMQNMFDFPPAPALTFEGRLDPQKASPQALAGEVVFLGKGRCVACHYGPAFLDHQMHDLLLERFYPEPGDGPMKTPTLRGLKDSPPYLHDGRCLTIEDVVEFFNLVTALKLTTEEKASLSEYLKQLYVRSGFAAASTGASD